MNPLNEYPALRKIAYIFQWVVNLALGILAIVFLNDSTPGVPQWFVITGLVFNFIWSYTGLTAQQNVPSVRDVQEGNAEMPRRRGDRGESSGLLPSVLGLVVGLVIVAAALLGRTTL